MPISLEQQARDVLERCGWEDAQRCTAGDVVEVANLLAEVERLKAIVDKLPKTADGESVVPGMTLWSWTADFSPTMPPRVYNIVVRGFRGEDGKWVLYTTGLTSTKPMECLFSTREAAEAAKAPDPSATGERDTP